MTKLALLQHSRPSNSSESPSPVSTRVRRRDQILAFFGAHIGKSFSTVDLHVQFGSAFRSRVSEVNRDLACPIVICNHTERSPDGQEASFYWAEPRRSPQNSPPEAIGTTPTFPQFGDFASESGGYPD